MIRLISAALALVLLALLALPGVVGNVTEERVQQWTAAVESSPFYEARLLEYDRRWFGTRARIEVGLDRDYLRQMAAATASEQDAAERERQAAIESLLARRLVFLVDSVHGPMSVAKRPFVGLSNAVITLDPGTQGLAELLERLELSGLFELRARTGFSGAVRFEGGVPEFHYREAQKRLEFSGLELEGSYVPRPGRLRSRAHIASVEMVSDQAGVVMRDFSWEGDNRMVSQYLWTGPAEAAIKLLRVTADEFEVPLAANDLAMRFSAALDDSGERFGLAVTYLIGSVDGPDGFALRDTSIVLALHDVDAAAFQAYSELAQRAAFAQPAQVEQLLGELQPIVNRLLASSPSLEIGPVRFRYDDEPFGALVHIQTDGSRLPPGGLPLHTPALWLQVLSVSAQVEAGASLAELIAAQVARGQIESAIEQGAPIREDQVEPFARQQAPELLRMLVEQGLLRRTMASYRSDLRYAQGVLAINGQPIQLDLFQ